MPDRNPSPEKNWKVVAALDLGTTYSGFAYCVRTDKQREPEVVTNPPWPSGGIDLLFLKTPTTVLIDEHGRLDKFGFEAETKYSSLVIRKQHRSWFYFSRFKMKLYREYGSMETMSRNFKLTDESGKEMLAMDVFACAIRYLMERLETTIKEQGHVIKSDDILWVVTVPAIWDTDAKQFMRESAVKAGVPGGQLVLALEAEAASLYTLTLHKSDGGTQKPLVQKGQTYVLVDLGGGTADVSVHRAMENGVIQELHRPTGGYWGGTQVDMAFDKLLADITAGHKDLLNRWKRDYQADSLDLKKDFEATKRTFDPTKGDELTIRIPRSLADKIEAEMGKSLEKIVERMYKTGDVIYASGRLLIEASVVKRMFKVSEDGIVLHLRQLFGQMTPPVSTVIMVGGFSQSPSIKAIMGKEFGSCNLIYPEKPEMAIVRGAALFGKNSKLVSQRISPYTYGVQLNETGPSGTIRADIFDVHVRAGDTMIVGKSRYIRKYTGVHGGQSCMILFVYRSTVKDPKFTTEKSCKRIGDLEIELPTDRSAEVEVEMRYWDTELLVTAKEIFTQTKVSVTLNTLN